MIKSFEMLGRSVLPDKEVLRYRGVYVLVSCKG